MECSVWYRILSKTLCSRKSPAVRSQSTAERFAESARTSWSRLFQHNGSSLFIAYRRHSHTCAEPKPPASNPGPLSLCTKAVSVIGQWCWWVTPLSP